jgi:2-polyprenyl-3-methyl-5-hydroxy-6-metoxy-1,4-benzoquinol methylase
MSQFDHLTTAYRDWDSRWTNQAERAGWLEPEPMVRALVGILGERQIDDVLDVGCGVGRHSRFLAEQGFRCSGIDASTNGIAYARTQAVAAGLEVDYREGSFLDLPFETASFGSVIAWNVVYHGDGEVVRAALAEITRVLRRGGIYAGTMLSKRNVKYGHGVEVRHDTFVVDGGERDTSHPHFYCDSRELLNLHAAYEIIELRDRQQTPGAHHWEFMLEKTR